MRYADEEHLPLESYKDPSPNQYVSFIVSLHPTTRSLLRTAFGGSVI